MKALSCPKCGAPLREQVLSCPYCGAGLVGDDASVQQNDPPRARWPRFKYPTAGRNTAIPGLVFSLPTHGNGQVSSKTRKRFTSIWAHQDFPAPSSGRITCASRPTPSTWPEPHLPGLVPGQRRAELNPPDPALPPDPGSPGSDWQPQHPG
jgi:hypothetical protein